MEPTESRVVRKSFGRKFWLAFLMGMSFMVASTYLIYVGIVRGVSMLEMAPTIAALAAGVSGVMGTFIWGNIREHQAETNQK